MNILLLGNGFDINCGLPTKYINYVQIVDFLNHHRHKKYETVGELFEDMLNNDNNSSVRKLYYDDVDLANIYSKIKINQDDIKNILEIDSNNSSKDIKDNIWFCFFSKNHITDLSWVGFEREMENVLIDLDKYKAATSSTDTEFINVCDPDFKKYDLIQSPECERIANKLKQFDIPILRYRPYDDLRSIKSARYESKKEAIYFDSASNNIRWNNIYKELEQERVELVGFFKNYLINFVEKISENEKFLQYANKQSEFLMEFNPEDVVINFNYTKTFEKLRLRLLNYNFNNKNSYSAKGPIPCFHIHGCVDDENIVMGIRPNDKGTEPLHFQKDIQRLRYNTNSEYNEWLRSNKEKNVECLTIMGSSLDVTDGDVIKKLFYRSEKIKVVYHDDDAHGHYCKNIKSILGTDGLEQLQDRFSFQDLKGCQKKYNSVKNKRSKTCVIFTPCTKKS